MSRFFSFASLALAGVVVLSATAHPVAAKEYNQRPFLAPGESAKVQRVISQGRAAQGHQFGLGGDSVGGPNASIVNTDCGKLSVGNVETSGRAGQRPPRENIVIAREIINAPINCGTRSRR
jgi:hypothetical protein